MKKILIILVLILSTVIPTQAENYDNVDRYEVVYFNYREPGKDWAFDVENNEDRVAKKFPIIFRVLEKNLYKLEVYWDGIKEYTLIGPGEKYYSDDFGTDVTKYTFIDYNKSKGVIEIAQYEDGCIFLFQYDNIELSFGADTILPPY